MIQSLPFRRRDFLNRLGCGFGAVALQALLRGESRASEKHNFPAKIDPIHPHIPRSALFAPKAKSVIFLFMVGGPSQVDTFDYKPLLQKLNGQRVPDSFRAAAEKTKFHHIFRDGKDLMGSPFEFSQHGASGKWVSDLYPHVAKHVDDLCFIHSMQADSNNHAPASYQLHTGETIPGKASLGSWVTYGLGTNNQDLPGYVMLFDAGPYGGAANYSNGFLPAAFQATRFRTEGTPVLDLVPPSHLASSQRASLDLINELNLKHRSLHKDATELDARIASYELAYRMQSAAMEVGALDQEPEAIKSSYGFDHADGEVAKFGRKCLMARRLVERGVRFVQIYNTMLKGDGWDAHTGLQENHRAMARQSDQPISALLSDLKQRGLLDETLVIWASEFGRTPMMQNDHGRQHNSAGFTIWMAGGGVKPGSIGSTDELGLMATENPHNFKDLHTTILAALGIDTDKLSFLNGGREERLTGLEGAGSIIPGVLG